MGKRPKSAPRNFVIENLQKEAKIKEVPIFGRSKSQREESVQVQMEKKHRGIKMSKQDLLGSNQHLDSLSTHLEMPDDTLSQSSSYFSVIELDNELIIERALQMASMMERSARDLKTYSRLAKQKDAQVNDKRLYQYIPFHNR